MGPPSRGGRHQSSLGPDTGPADRCQTSRPHTRSTRPGANRAPFTGPCEASTLPGSGKPPALPACGSPPQLVSLASQLIHSSLCPVIGRSALEGDAFHHRAVLTLLPRGHQDKDRTIAQNQRPERDNRWSAWAHPEPHQNPPACWSAPNSTPSPSSEGRHSCRASKGALQDADQAE
ncbi:hypothetical protein AAFF_G00317300 [Aldrovandia affinis]|uniref:Uncharacterized protein n=1 Tax=Aldrovandia affinis TaxID=143900 RepID=A0AAD7W0I9_9TELE|nr:hypothetical protein AAFF_G00317300 [Aldrovandia affinis]